MRDGMAQHGMAGAPGSVARHGGCLDLRSSLKQVGRVSLRVVGPLPLREGRNQTAKWHCGRSARACAAAEGEGRLSWRVACSASAASSTSRVTLVKSSGRRVGCSAAPSAEPHRLRGRSRRGSRRCASPTQQPRCAARCEGAPELLPALALVATLPETPAEGVTGGGQSGNGDGLHAAEKL